MPSCSTFSAADIPDLSGKVIIVTGGNSGVGLESVLQLSKHNPAKLYMTARSQSKFDTAMEHIHKSNPTANVTFLPLDLASFTSIASAASTITSTNSRLDILMNNAGVMALPPGLTAEGYEIQFGTNQLGHALFTKLLLPLLLKTAESPSSDVRIVTLSSAAEALAPGAGFLPDVLTTTMESYHTYRRYAHSKLANVLFTRELARRYPTIKSVAVHPGRVKTSLLDGFFSSTTNLTTLMQNTYDMFMMMDVEKGSLTQLFAAVGPKEVVKSASYYTPIAKEGGDSKRSKDMALAERLWEWQEGEFKKHGY